MAISVQLDFAGGSFAQYDEVIRKMGFRPNGPGAPALLFHWSAMTSDGLRVVDTWTTREAFDSYAQEKIDPLTQAAGLPQPNAEFFEVHNYLTAG